MKKGIIFVLLITVVMIGGCANIIPLPILEKIKQCPESCDDGNICTIDRCSEKTRFNCVSIRDLSCCRINSDCEKLGANYLCRDMNCLEVSDREMMVETIRPWYLNYSGIISDLDSRLRKSSSYSEYAESIKDSDIKDLNNLYTQLHAMSLPKTHDTWLYHANLSLSQRIESLDNLVKLRDLTPPDMGEELTIEKLQDMSLEIYEYNQKQDQYKSFIENNIAISKSEMENAMLSLS